MAQARPAQPILVVEDDEDSRNMIATVLAVDGFRVVTASNGAEGLALAKRSRPCLILLDLMMPAMSGDAFRLEQLRDRALRNVPTVIVSARHDAARIAEELGCVACLEKPVDVERLEQVITHCAAGDVPWSSVTSAD